MGVAVFNLTLFLAMYPEFTAFNTAFPNTLAANFIVAGLYLNNTQCSPVTDLGIRLTLLNMLVAHISYLNGALSADGQTRPVGRVSQASEGSVSASFDGVPPTPGSGSWYDQSQYGAAFWQATFNLRGMQYVAAPLYPWGNRRIPR